MRKPRVLTHSRARVVASIFTTTVAAAVIALDGAQAQRQAPAPSTPAAVEAARARGLEDLRIAARAQGLGDETDFAVTEVHVDALAMAHTRVQQRYRGVPVFGGEGIAHLTVSGAVFARTEAFLSGISVDTTPRLTAAAAITRATEAYGCADCLTAAPAADLWILRRGGLDRLVYRVQMRREDGTPETALPVAFVDAHSGEIVWRYDNLQTGYGSSLYSGTVPLSTAYHPSFALYALEDLARRIGTYDLRNASTLFYFVDPNDVWDSPSQRAAVDAHYAMERFLAYLAAAHGRNGLDGAGGPFSVSSFDGSMFLLSSAVHYGVGYNNAFWNGQLMVYGDGDGVAMAPLVSPDIAAHEMQHGVTEFTAGLVYEGESGALNESWSDVFGALFERDVHGESANTWLIGEQAYTPGIHGDALRSMADPHSASDKGFTANDDPDHYSERYTGSLDNGGVHVNSGIANKAFYLLAKGGGHHAGGSMAGIGPDAAARIWFLALTSYMTSTTTFAGARTATMNAAAALYGTGSVQQTAVAAAWCLVGVGTCSVPSVDLVTPAAGTGAAQQFVLRYSDSETSANLRTAWVWFDATGSGSAAGSCLAHYDRSVHRILLLNDAGTAWSSGAIGAPETLENSQCAVALSASGANLSGTTLTVTLAMSFKPSYTGAKNIYLFAASAAGANTGWQDRGDWTIPAPAVVSAVSVTPSAGSGASQAFDFEYADSLGAGDLMTAWVWFRRDLASSAASSCLIYYERASATLFLLDDAGTTWHQAALGSTGALENSQCAVDTGGSHAVAGGDTLTLHLAVSFKASFNGDTDLFMYAAGSGGASSGWQDRGNWTVAVPTAVVDAVSASPSSGSGASAAFSLRYSDSTGAAGLTAAWVWFTEAFGTSAADSCLLYYDRPTGSIFLLNDAGTTWLSAAPGSGVLLENGQCAADMAATQVAISGTFLEITLAVTFHTAFAGDKQIFMYASNGTGAASGWQDRGDWSVPAEPAVVSAVSVAPSAGSGVAATFALEYSDSAGAEDLSTVWVWFTASFGASADDSCLVYYDRRSDVVHLLDDAGTVWIAGVPGAAGTLANAQCAIDLDGIAVLATENVLRLTLPVSFRGAYLGTTMQVFMYAAGSGGAASGWHDRGEWTAPPGS